MARGGRSKFGRAAVPAEAHPAATADDVEVPLDEAGPTPEPTVTEPEQVESSEVAQAPPKPVFTEPELVEAVDVAPVSPEPAAPPPSASAPAWKPPAHHTLCNVVTTGTVSGKGYTAEGAPRPKWKGGERAWFADRDVLSLPDILIPA